MYLIRTDELDLLKLAFFHSHDPPPHAIVSHTWGQPADEVLFDDIQAGIASTKTAYDKVLRACLQAQKDGLAYLWIDTACIQQSNSSELIESLNSMYLWYRNATKCYAYLQDVTETNVLNSRGNDQFANSRWFSRGWTLQELLAPPNVTFFNREWIAIGDKISLNSQLSRITRIPEQVLLGEDPVNSASIAQRMALASYRETTRLEDMAYCMMGIFSVHMSMLYGSRDEAFIALQDEIMKKNDDMSLFVWSDHDARPVSSRGLLASHPSTFKRSSTVKQCPPWSRNSPYGLANGGLRVGLPVLEIEPNIFAGVMNFTIEKTKSNPYAGYLSIFLRSKSDDTFERVNASQFLLIHTSMKRMTWKRLFIPQYNILTTHDDAFSKTIEQLAAIASGKSYTAMDSFMDSDLEIMDNPVMVPKVVAQRSRPANPGMVNIHKPPNIRKQPLPRPIFSIFKDDTGKGIPVRWMVRPVYMKSHKMKNDKILACSTVFRSETGERLLVTVGQARDNWLTFNARELPENSLDQLAKISIVDELWNGQYLNTEINTHNHRIRVTSNVSKGGGDRRVSSVEESFFWRKPVPEFYIDITSVIGISNLEEISKDQSQDIKHATVHYDTQSFKPPPETLNLGTWSRFKKWYRRSKYQAQRSVRRNISENHLAMSQAEVIEGLGSDSEGMEHIESILSKKRDVKVVKPI